MPIPDFDDLPKVEGMPQGCAWGVFDKDGKKDLLGTMNLLTPSVVAAAAAEVKDGVSISLNWPLNAMSKLALPGRIQPVHKVHTLASLGLAPPGSHGFDDELTFNTQSSSQWDSLCHVAHQPTGLSYNGARATESELSSPSSPPVLPTIDHWHARGGLVGRGVLIDFKGWMDARPGAKEFHPFDAYGITAEEVEAVARDQGVEFREGDVLIVRTGMTEVYEGAKPEDLARIQKPGAGLSGLQSSVDTARWVWNKHFAAVAGDSSAFEAMVLVKPDGTHSTVHDLVLHQHFLSMFGLPIGELWDLKELAAYCKKTGRYSFLLTSAPLHHPGLVASPPNALAIF